MQKLYFLDNQSANEYLRGEREGRRDGARRWGKSDTSSMTENEAMGYRDGYAATSCL